MIVEQTFPHSHGDLLCYPNSSLARARMSNKCFRSTSSLYLPDTNLANMHLVLQTRNSSYFLTVMMINWKQKRTKDQSTVRCRQTPGSSGHRQEHMTNKTCVQRCEVRSIMKDMHNEEEGEVVSTRSTGAACCRRTFSFLEALHQATKRIFLPSGFFCETIWLEGDFFFCYLIEVDFAKKATSFGRDSFK